MKKLFYLAFIAVVALSFGCAITDYPVITDNEDDSGNYTVNTNGQASIQPTGQTIVIGADSNTELHSAVDQNGGGDQTITTYVNTTHGSSPDFLAFTYCNVDQDGCWVTKAPNPASGDASIFDYTDNRQCDGWETLFFLVSFGARTTECGRGYTPFMQANSLPAIGDFLSDLTPVNRYGRDGYNFYANRRNVSATLRSVVTGDQYAMAIPSMVLFFDGQANKIIEYSANMNILQKQLQVLHRAHPEGFQVDISGPAGLHVSGLFNLLGTIDQTL